MQANGMELYLPPTKGMSKAQREILERAQELNIGIRQE